MIKSKQLENGKNGEEIVGNIFQENGYWFHIFASKIGGQPVDIIALKGDKHWLVDAKYLGKEKISFPFSRIEPNQLSCMNYARNFSNIQNLGFVIISERFDLKAFYLSYDKLIELKGKGAKSVNLNDLKGFVEYL